MFKLHIITETAGIVLYFLAGELSWCSVFGFRFVWFFVSFFIAVNCTPCGLEKKTYIYAFFL